MDEIKKFSKEIQQKVKLALNKKEGTLFECNNSLCNNSWRSKKIVYTCPKCKKKRVSLIYDEKNKPKKGIYFFKEDEW
jgi:Zn finger protein HypA/HybF involved in hydrogenase expression